MKVRGLLAKSLHDVPYLPVLARQQTVSAYDVPLSPISEEMIAKLTDAFVVAEDEERAVLGFLTSVSWDRRGLVAEAVITDPDAIDAIRSDAKKEEPHYFAFLVKELVLKLEETSRYTTWMHTPSGKSSEQVEEVRTPVTKRSLVNYVVLVESPHYSAFFIEEIKT